MNTSYWERFLLLLVVSSVFYGTIIKIIISTSIRKQRQLKEAQSSLQQEISKHATTNGKLIDSEKNNIELKNEVIFGHR